MTLITTMMMVRPLIADLRARRATMGIKARQVDEEAGFTDALVEKMETGNELNPNKRVPSLASLITWAEALGCEVRIIPKEEREPTPREVKKMRALLYLCEGLGVRQVARMLQIPPSTVLTWKRAVQRSHTRGAPLASSESISNDPLSLVKTPRAAQVR